MRAPFRAHGETREEGIHSPSSYLGSTPVLCQALHWAQGLRARQSLPSKGPVSGHLLSCAFRSLSHPLSHPHLRCLASISPHQSACSPLPEGSCQQPPNALSCFPAPWEETRGTLTSRPEAPRARPPVQLCLSHCPSTRPSFPPSGAWGPEGSPPGSLGGQLRLIPSPPTLPMSPHRAPPVCFLCYILTCVPPISL